MWYWVASAIVAVLFIFTRYLVPSSALVLGFIPAWMAFTLFLALVYCAINFVYAFRFWDEEESV